MKIFRKKGFTLVEIMIVVAIIGLLAAIAIPNFVRARKAAQVNTCLANLKQIEGAKEIRLIDGESAATTIGDLVPVYLKHTPKCPVDGDLYTIGDTDTVPSCPNWDADTHPAKL